jgi:hypothetical protein
VDWLRCRVAFSDAFVAIDAAYRPHNPEESPQSSPDIWKPSSPGSANATGTFPALSSASSARF